MDGFNRLLCEIQLVRPCGKSHQPAYRQNAIESLVLQSADPIFQRQLLGCDLPIRKNHRSTILFKANA